MVKKGKTEKGQGLVEFALVIAILIVTFLNVIDFVFRFANEEQSRYYAFQAAREASMYLNTGGYSCDSWVRSHTPTPILWMVGEGDWTLTLTGCPADPSWSQVSGTPVSATIAWHQDTVWWPESGEIGAALAQGSVTVEDTFQ